MPKSPQSKSPPGSGSGGESDYYILDPAHTDSRRLRAEREKAQKLKKSSWWQQQLARGTCHYCSGKFSAVQLTMDHVVPLARGGTSTPGNLVPACQACNRDKKLRTPVEDIFKQLEEERKRQAVDSEPGPKESDDD